MKSTRHINCYIQTFRGGCWLKMAVKQECIENLNPDILRPVTTLKQIFPLQEDSIAVHCSDRYITRPVCHAL